MPVTQDSPAPYAPASAIIGLIDRHRQRGLPTPINSEVLARAGISESLIPRTLQALNTLDLIVEDGRPSPVLEGLRLAPEAEFKQRLAEWLNNAYADALNFIDPADAEEVNIRDAFRGYKPTGQQDRMVSLFIGLYSAAGVRAARERQPTVRKLSNGQAVKPRPTIKRNAESAKSLVDRAPLPNQHIDPGLPPAVSGLLASLPTNGQGWTRTRRDGFLSTFGAVLDFCYPTIAAEPSAGEQEEGA